MKRRSRWSGITSALVPMLALTAVLTACGSPENRGGSEEGAPPSETDESEIRFAIMQPPISVEPGGPDGGMTWMDARGELTDPEQPGVLAEGLVQGIGYPTKIEKQEQPCPPPPGALKRIEFSVRNNGTTHDFRILSETAGTRNYRWQMKDASGSWADFTPCSEPPNPVPTCTGQGVAPELYGKLDGEMLLYREGVQDPCNIGGFRIALTKPAVGEPNVD